MPFEENWAVLPRPDYGPLRFSHSASFTCLASTVQPSAIGFGTGSTRESRFAAPRFSTPNEPQIPVLQESLRLLSAL
jgi:hypothetical protein